MRIRQRRVALNRSQQQVFGIIEALESGVERSKRRGGGCVRRIGRSCALEPLDRLPLIASAVEHFAEQMHCRGMPWIGRQNRLACAQCLGHSAGGKMIRCDIKHWRRPRRLVDLGAPDAVEFSK